MFQNKNITKIIFFRKKIISSERSFFFEGKVFVHRKYFFQRNFLSDKSDFFHIYQTRKKRE